MQQSGLKATALRKEDISNNDMLVHMDDDVIMKLTRQIELMFFQEMLTKCLQLLDNNWVKKEPEGESGRTSKMYRDTCPALKNKNPSVKMILAATNEF